MVDLAAVSERQIDPAALSQWMKAALGAEVRLDAIRPLGGGAIQENWRIDAVVGDEPRSFVLRRDAPARLSFSHDRRTEFDIVRVAHAAGVSAPEPVAFCEDCGPAGGPFALFGFVEGRALARLLMRDPSIAERGPLIARQAGMEMARIHKVTPPHPGLGGLAAPPADRALADVHQLRQRLDRHGIIRPVLEWGLRWAETSRPDPEPPVLIHRDFRTGNYIVDDMGLAAVLDWEFAAWGDRHVDLGWFCAECWRFGRRDRAAGGIGDRQDLYAGYEEAGGAPVEDQRVRFWEVMAHLRWAVIALEQGMRHTSGEEPSLELALTARIVPELELAVARATSPARWGRMALAGVE
jgi:aminoglycoside phosphotransferase (APT) family kinase protein